jgi:hypothetical protein
MEANKKAQVIMLPTDKSNLFTVKHTGSIQLSHKLIMESVNLQPQHLYFTTDDKIMIGDYIVQTTSKISHSSVIKIENKGQCIIANDNTGSYTKRKIISTNDSKLNLPKPSKKFIEQYCKLGGIDKVLVEVEKYYVDEKTSNKIHYFGFEFDDAVDSGLVVPKEVNTIKTNYHNEITIHPIKDSWTREEVIEVINNFTNSDEIAFALKGTFDKPLEITEDWIKENL